MKNNKLREHVATHLLIYVAILIAVIIFWDWIFGFLTEPKKEETVYFLFCCDDVNNDSLTSKLNDKSVKPQQLKQTIVRYYGNNNVDSNLYAQLQVFGFEESDILILPKDVLDKMTSYVTAYCIPLTEVWVNANVGEQLTNVVGQIDYYSCGKNNYNYGVKVYDSATGRGVAIGYVNYGNGENAQDYYLLITTQSVHVSSLNGNSSIDDHAITLLKAFILL